MTRSENVVIEYENATDDSFKMKCNDTSCYFFS